MTCAWTNREYRSDDDEFNEEYEDQEAGSEVPSTLKTHTDDYGGEICATPEVNLAKFESDTDDHEDHLLATGKHFHPTQTDIISQDTEQSPTTTDPTGYMLNETEFDSDDIEDTSGSGIHYDPNVATSTFAPFPSEMPETEEEFIAMMTKSQEQDSTAHSGDQQFNNEKTLTPVRGSPSMGNLEISQQIRPDPKSPIAQDIVYSDSEEEEYVPRQSHFRSEVISSPVKEANRTSKDQEDGISLGSRKPQTSDVERPNSEGSNQQPATATSASGYVGSPQTMSSTESADLQILEEPEFVESEGHRLSAAEDEDYEEVEEYVPHRHHYQPEVEDECVPPIEQVSVGADQYATSPSALPTTMNHKDLSIEPVSAGVDLEQPQMSPSVYELSDTDTLHINEPNNGSADSSLQEISKDTSLPGPEVAGIPNSGSMNNHLEEHAYLSDLIHTPVIDENESQFSKSSESQGNLGAVYDNRSSQFYSSVSDYFADYADEENHEGLTVQRTRSSGSLSTGSFSLHSGAHRSSKMSDRTASFTQSISHLSDLQSTKEHETGESNLNPALSINMGHWRPNTESFRNQFINDSAAIPPLPQLDNYARNPKGEIVEDARSLASETANNENAHAESPNFGSDEKDTSMLSTFDSSAELEQPDTHGNKDGVYKTDSETILPIHIPVGTFDSSSGNYFQEHLSSSGSLPLNVESQAKEIRKRKPVSYSVKSISTLKDATARIQKYRDARQEEANCDTGLEIWITQALEKADLVNYQSNVTSHVKQAYAEASNFSKRHTNMGSLLQKRRVMETSSQTAQSLAKGARGIFTRGKKIIKNEK